MTGEPRTWLPRESYSLEALNTALQAIFREWSESWLPGRNAPVHILSISNVRFNPSPQSHYYKGEVISAQLSGNAKRQMIEAALSVDLGQLSLTENDHKVLDHLVSDMASDMIALLEENTGKTSFSPSDDGMPLCLSLGIENKEILRIYSPADFYADRIRVQITTSRPDTGPVCRESALGSSSLKMEAIIGGAWISVADLQDLEIDDVIVLEPLLVGTADVRLKHDGQIFARAAISQHAGHITLTL